MISDIQFLAEMCGDDCNWFLVGLRDSKMVAYDGCWSTLENVGKARYLREQLKGNQPDWYAVYIIPVESVEYNVNREAIQNLNNILAKE